MGGLIMHPAVQFDIQHSREQVFLLIRSHPITQVPWILNSIGIVLITGVLNFFVPLVLTAPQIFFLNFFGVGIASLYAWVSFLKWYFHVGLVTNERIIDIDFTNVLFREVSIAQLVDVEDVSTSSVGYIGSLFNFGDIDVQTAGTKTNVEFHNAPDPATIIRTIDELSSQTNVPNA